MTNIVERLLGPHEWGYRELTGMGFTPDDAPFEAADEIERLKAKVEQKSTDLSVLAQRIEERDAEIERLHFIVEELQIVNRQLAVQLQKLGGKITEIVSKDYAP